MDINLSFNNLSKIDKIQLCTFKIKPILNKNALFSDETSSYRIPAEPMPEDEITLKFRTAKNNVDSVFIICGNERIEMQKYTSDKLFDYYKGILSPSSERREYFFEINSGKATCYYNRRGVMRDNQDYYNFKISPGFKTPDWAKGAVIYQIYVDRFYNGDTSNDVVDREYSYINQPVRKISDWSQYPAQMDVGNFYGGDLMGVLKKLDYLQGLGVEVIYFNPIFVSPSNHKYDIQDYDYVDPHLGVIVKDEGEPLPEGVNDNLRATKYISRVSNLENLEASNAFFAELVEEIHRRGMKVIIDGVFNHCGSFNKWLDRERIYENQSGYEKGAYISKDSPYNTFFHFSDENAWPYNGSYDGWWGHNTLPKLNYEASDKLYNYILRIAKKWVSPPYNVDGWRLDVAADLGHSPEYNHKFWKDFRKAVKEANPNAIVLAEHYGDPGAWLEGDEWDTVMNYDAFMEPITWFLTGVEKHSDEFRGDLLGNCDSFFNAMSHHMARFHTQSLQVSMNELSNHDHSRFLTRTNRRVGRINTLGPEMANENVNRGVFREAVVIQMTWPGAPTIYYGDEAGVCGWTDPDNRRTYPWGCEDRELLRFHRDIIKVHKSYNTFKTGSLKFVYGTHKVISYGRFDAENKFIIIINNNYENKELSINVAQIGVSDEEKLEQIMLTLEDGYSMDNVIYKVENGKLNINMPKISAIILKAVE